MTREDYKSIKEEVKKMAIEIKRFKNEMRESNREYSHGKCDHRVLMNAIYDYNTAKWNFRVKHIFMSLVRGRTRNQIENTFDKKDRSNFLEDGIKKLCEKYGFDVQTNKIGQILSVTCKDDTEAKLVLESKATSEVQAVI